MPLAIIRLTLVSIASIASIASVAAAGPAAAGTDQMASASATRTITVAAASSLSDAFRTIARSYEAKHEGSRVRLTFAASGALLQQIANGAPVDVFASADQQTMNQAESKALVEKGQRRDFAGNTLVLVVPIDARVAIDQLADLGNPAVELVAIGNPASVPVGRYARLALEAAGLWPALAGRMINAQNARQVLDYVARGEVDAGFVYATDAMTMPDRVEVAFVVPLTEKVTYPIAPVAASANAGEARRFMAYVLSPEGQAILGRYGFLPP